MTFYGYIFLITIILVAVIAIEIVLRRKSRLLRRVQRVIASPSELSNYVIGMKSERQINSWEIMAINHGLADAFDKAKELGYTNKIRRGDYTIGILKPDGVNKYGDPIFNLGGEQITGQAVDVDKCIIAVPFHDESQAEHLRLTVHFEAEHCLAKNNDIELYNRTKIHKPGEGHPILGQ